jgi:hypothetical protein
MERRIMTTHTNRVKQGNKVQTARRAGTPDAVRLAVQRAKNDVLSAYASRVGSSAHLLRLALNEAEGLAWQTEFPQLVFPALAQEKAEAAVAWHERQAALRRPLSEASFAE